MRYGHISLMGLRNRVIILWLLMVFVNNLHLRKLLWFLKMPLDYILCCTSHRTWQSLRV